VVVEEPKVLVPDSKITQVSSYRPAASDSDGDQGSSTKPFTLIFSANDETSLREATKAMREHLMNPRVKVQLPDLAYTLSERRTYHFHRAYIVTQSTVLDENFFVFGKKATDPPRIGFVFTGQGAQWSQMGKDLVENFPRAKRLLEYLDNVLQHEPVPPSWSLLSEPIRPSLCVYCLTS
jgi:acyl transferase domain-containing protein